MIGEILLSQERNCVTCGKIFVAKKQNRCYSCINKERKRKADEWFNEARDKDVCEHCGNQDSRVLEYHHLDPKQKKFSLSDRSRQSIKAIKEEKAKCIPLCANCHRILHYEENNS